MNIYPNIDMKRTGNRIEAALRAAGFDVKMIQNYLHLSCPQPIYRWFKGQILPSVDHLYVLSGLLGMHMEDLIVPKRRNVQLFLEQTGEIVFIVDGDCDRSEKRLLAYWQSVQGIAA